MQSYPTIPAEVSDATIIAFDKLDGSNVRAEWSRKRGIHKFGSRQRLFDETDLLLGPAKNLILEKYSDDLGLPASSAGTRESSSLYWGVRSFAGNHDPGDPTRTVTLFDAAPDKQGILEPREFLKVFGRLDVPAVLYEGKASQPFIEEVRSGTLAGMTFEGVVCKGRRRKKDGLPVLFKVKSQQWFDRLREFCKGDDALFQRLM